MHDRDHRKPHLPPPRVAAQIAVPGLPRRAQSRAEPIAPIGADAQDDWPDGIPVAVPGAVPILDDFDAVPAALDEDLDSLAISTNPDPLVRIERIGRRTERRAKRNSEQLGLAMQLLMVEIQDRRNRETVEVEDRRTRERASLEARKVNGDRLWKAVMYVLMALAAYGLGVGTGAGVIK